MIISFLKCVLPCAESLFKMSIDYSTSSAYLKGLIIGIWLSHLIGGVDRLNIPWVTILSIYNYIGIIFGLFMAGYITSKFHQWSFRFSKSSIHCIDEHFLVEYLVYYNKEGQILGEAPRLKIDNYHPIVVNMCISILGFLGGYFFPFTVLCLFLYNQHPTTRATTITLKRGIYPAFVLFHDFATFKPILQTLICDPGATVGTYKTPVIQDSLSKGRNED